MLRILRFIGLLNAAVWLGGMVFFSFVATPTVFQPEMKRLFREYYVGLIAQMMLERYFTFQLVCGMIALLQFPAEWFLLRRAPQKLWLGWVTGLYALVLLGGFWFQPKLRALAQLKYTAPTLPQRAQATKCFRAWHGASQAVNLLVLAGVACYVWRTAKPPRV